MTEQELAEIEARWAKATPGPWEHSSYLSGTESILIRVGPNKIPKENPYEDNRGFIAANVYCHDIRGFDNTEDEIQQEKQYNAEAIANAPTDIAALLAEVRRLNRMLVTIYNSGYHAGHHDTVEGQYTHILPQEMDSYQADIVEELIAEYAESEVADNG